MRLRNALALLAGAVVAACAQPGAPPGGPPDDAAPILLTTLPESSAVNVRASAVLLRFDEVVNERPTGVTTTLTSNAIAALVLLSPTDGKHQVRWRRDAIEIEPRGAFRPNTAYRVTLLPGLSDLRGNVRSVRTELVFTTGSTIPAGVVSGAVFDWVGARTAPLARVELFRDDDTTFRWVTRADSSGRYALRDLLPGSYRLRAWLDANNDNVIGPRELFDSTRVSLEQVLARDLYAFEHDTIGPRITSVELVDSTAIRIRLDRGVVVGFKPDSSNTRLVRADSTMVPIGVALPSTEFDSLRRASSAIRDSTPRDTAAADSTARRDTTARDTARDSVARAAMPLIERPIPVTSWVVPLVSPLPVGTYVLSIRGFPGLTGASGPSLREIRVRPPPPPKDSAAAAPTRPPP